MAGHVVGEIDGGGEAFGIGLDAGLRTGLGDDMISIGPVKFFMDGALSGETAALREILRGDVPVVVDAGALDLVGDASAPVIVTPHDREHDRLRHVFGLASVDGDRVDAAVETARVAGVVVLLKGARTVVADPQGAVHRIDVETHRLATAGSGDVLAGVVGALAAAVSTGTPLASVAASGAWLHSRAALLAVRANGGGPVTALDVAASLPVAIGVLAD